LRRICAGEANAIDRLRRHHVRWADVDESTLRQQVALHDAQFTLAREQGFASWPKLIAFLESTTGSRHTRRGLHNSSVHGYRLHCDVLTRSCSDSQRNCPGLASTTDPRFAACNYIPGTRINPIAAAMLSKLVMPTLPGFTNNYFLTSGYDGVGAITPTVRTGRQYDEREWRLGRRFAF
jgi:hypothetical protein